LPSGISPIVTRVGTGAVERGEASVDVAEMRPPAALKAAASMSYWRALEASPPVALWFANPRGFG
jgi:hypothetical protein